MNLHDTHQGSIEVIRLWLFGIENLNVICSSWNAEDFAIEEIAGELSGF